MAKNSASLISIADFHVFYHRYILMPNICIRLRRCISFLQNFSFYYSRTGIVNISFRIISVCQFVCNEN